MLELNICPHDTVPVVRLPEKALLVHDMSDAEMVPLDVMFAAAIVPEKVEVCDTDSVWQPHDAATVPCAPESNPDATHDAGRMFTPDRVRSGGVNVSRVLYPVLEESVSDPFPEGDAFVGVCNAN